MKTKKLLINSFIHTDFAPQCIWNMFYPKKVEKSYINEKITNKVDNPKDKYIFFYDCFFFGFRGGCIDIHNKNELKCLISFCRFSNNSKFGSSGCIALYGDNQIVQHRLCLYDIIPQYFFAFCYAYISRYNYNYYIENSLTQGKSSNYGDHVYLVNGLIQFSSTNSSGNDGNESPGYKLLSPTSNFSLPSIINYSTFEGNKADHYILSLLSMDKDRYYIFTKSNILNNTILNAGHLWSYADTATSSFEVIDCNFFGNKGGVLFEISGGKMNVKNCSIDNFTHNGHHGYTISNELIDTKSMVHVLSHHSTHGCKAVLPQFIHIKFYGRSYLNYESETIQQTYSCKYKKFFRGSVKIIV